MTWRGVREDDWVRCTRGLTTGALGGTSIRRGTRGVVTRVHPGWFGSRAEVVFDGGFGTVGATVPVGALRVVRGGGGEQRFRTRQARVTAARAALALFLVWPVLSWVAQHVWFTGGFSGITAAFALGVIDSVAYYLDVLVSDPVHSLIYIAFLTVVGRLAWR